MPRPRSPRLSLGHPLHPGGHRGERLVELGCVLATGLGQVGTAAAAAAHQLGDLLDEAARLDGLDPDGLRSVVDTLRDRLPSGVIVLGSAVDGKVSLVAAVSKDLMKRFPAGRLVQEVAKLVGGGGGGRPDLAQAGGKDASKLDEALATVSGWVERTARA